MKLSKGLLFIGLVLAIGIAWLWCNGCDKRTVAPEPEPVAPIDYPVYFADQIDPLCYRYRVVSETLDTIALPFMAAVGLDISPDGSTLYVGGEYEVAALNLATGESDIIWPEIASNGITVSPDGRYLALHGAELNILELVSLTVVHHEAEIVFRGVFSSDSRQFYAPTEHAQILRVGLEGSGAVSRTSFPSRNYGRIAVAADGSRWYLYDLGECLGRFEVYDLFADSIVFSHSFRHGYGFLEPTADGQYVFFSNPGLVMAYCWQYDHELAVGAYDIGGNELAAEISTRNIPFPVDGVDSTSVAGLATTPDSRWLVGLSYRGDIVRVDLEGLEIVSFSRFDAPRPIVEYPCCQTEL